ncbi:hypothetical protein TELCIR_19722 [Teladorsagia circumcincta]|uniref:Uncharacterized protein n=1 Tax=Teladorsagia circumcincta TaxID=45464 RepID=A0A2G9TMX8_TELCI|nr:hypothetical protein TELCIR_19722 [Teladorsagia circumcincta]
MSVAHRSADSQEIKTENMVNGPEVSVAVERQSSSAEGTNWNPCKNEVEESAQVNGTTGDDDSKEVSLLDMVETFSADIEAFREAADELETMSESVQCLMRNAVHGDGRPVGVWKDVC